MDKLECVCPRCHGALDDGGDHHTCAACGARFPVVAGIPDFRLAPDPYIGLEADRAKAERLAAAASGASCADMLDAYFGMTPEVPPDLADRYRRHHLAGVDRGQALLARIETRGIPKCDTGRRWLDLGCGTAGFLAAARTAGAASGALVGVDVALRWLVVARAFLSARGAGDVRLVCAGADRLPFADGRFDLVVAEHLLEHAGRVAPVLAEARRVRATDGAFLARAVNRYALGPEPHVGLWGVGFLPRRLMDRYVRWRKGIPFEHVRSPSVGSLERVVRAGGHDDLRVQAPFLVPLDYAHQPPVPRRLFGAFRWAVSNVPPLRPVLKRFGPYLDLVAVPTERSATP